jgi:uncharacterized protein YlxW (UPF0749 family)
MKRIKSQLGLGLICLILGLMISFQFKVTNNPQSLLNGRKIEDTAQNLEDLKKQRDELLHQVQEYQKKVDAYEKNAASVSETAGKMKDELDRLRILAGLTDVEGQGIIITITPIVDVTTRQTSQVYYKDLIDVVNELNSAGAEAISINDERYVSRTQIREAGSVIKINDGKFDPTQPFVIKAIGDPKILEGAFKMPGSPVEVIEKLSGCKVDIASSQNIKILKYNKYVDYKYIKAGR